MTFQATEGNGGAPVRLHRVGIERPTIARGAITVPGTNHLGRTDIGDHDVRIADQKATFTVTNADGYTLTYHDVDVISLRDGVTVFVGPHDVVTWEKA